MNFQDNATRNTGAISYLLFTSFGVSSNNTIQRAEFVNAKPVYFPPMENKWSNDDYGNGSYRTSVFHDADGSVTGIPDSYVLINDENNGIAIDDACEIRSDWNAAVCTGDVGRMTVGGGGGGGGRGGFGRGGFGGGRGAFGGRGGGAGAAPPQAPIVLSRYGRDLSVGQTNVRAGTEITVTTQRPSVSLSVSELDSGSWVIFELPGFTTAASGTAESSLDALRQASATSYYTGNGSLWVKLVSSGNVLGSGPGSGPSGGASLQVSR